MNLLKKRVEALEKGIREKNGGLFTVYYKDGTSRIIEPGEALVLSLNEGEKILRFEEMPGGKNNGILEGLANALLVDTTEERREAEE